MIGVGVVSLFTLFAGSLRSSIRDSVGRSFTGDLAVTTPAWGGGALDPRIADRVDALPEIDVAVGIGQTNAPVAGSKRELSVAFASWRCCGRSAPAAVSCARRSGASR